MVLLMPFVVAFAVVSWGNFLGISRDAMFISFWIALGTLAADYSLYRVLDRLVEIRNELKKV
jgi:hypothetical protein